MNAIPELTEKELREFGRTTGIAVALIFGLFFPWMLGIDWPAWPWFIASCLWALALIKPIWLRPIYRGWMRFGLLASKVMTPLVLGIVYFLMISPMSLVRRLLGKDSMNRELDPEGETYRVKSAKSPKEKLERPF